MMKRLLIAFGAFLLLTVTAVATPLFAVCATACTWDNSSTLMWSTSSGGVTGAGPPGASDTVTLDGATCVGGVTCTVTLNFGGPITIQSLTMGACTASTTGCIFDNSVNNNNITITGTGSVFNISGTGVRNIKLGSATYELSGSNATFTAITHTNLTLAAGTSTIFMSGTAGRTFSGGNQTFATVRSGAMLTTGGGGLFIQGSNTFATLRIDPPAFVEVTVGESNTVTSSVNWTGTSTAQIGITTTGNSTSSSWVFPASQTLAYVALRGLNVTSGAPVANNSLDLKNNTGITINPPAASAGGGCILGGWLLWRDLPEHINDNFPAWLEKAA